MSDRVGAGPMAQLMAEVLRLHRRTGPNQCNCSTVSMVSVRDWEQHAGEKIAERIAERGWDVKARLP